MPRTSPDNLPEDSNDQQARIEQLTALVDAQFKDLRDKSVHIRNLESMLGQRGGDGRAPRAAQDSQLPTALQTWNPAREPLESIEARIHDGVPLDKLHDRANGYLNTLYGLFPAHAPTANDVVVEIGPGVGYIMEAVQRRFSPARIIGLDVAPAMIAHARARLERDLVDVARMEFQAYDGVTMPFADASIDHIYSIACLQHVPKPLVYNLFTECLRVLRGSAALHLLSFSFLRRQHAQFSEEVHRQVHESSGHWHHFYSREELVHVLDALGARHVEITEHDGMLWTVFRN